MNEAVRLLLILGAIQFFRSLIQGTDIQFAVMLARAVLCLTAASALHYIRRDREQQDKRIDEIKGIVHEIADHLQSKHQRGAKR